MSRIQIKVMLCLFIAWRVGREWSERNQMVLKGIRMGEFQCNLHTQWYPMGMVLKEATVYKMVDNFAKN